MTKLVLDVVPELAGYPPDEGRLSVVATARLEGPSARAPHRVVLAIDHSSSMGGAPLADALRCAHALVQALDASDELALVAFDAKVEVVLPPTALDPRGRARAHAALTTIVCGRGTDLCGALVTSARLARETSRPARAILLSDGHAYCGETDPVQIVRRLRRSTAPRVSVGAVALGEEADRMLLRAVALAGRGRFSYVERGTSAVEVIGSELGVIAQSAVVAVTAELVPSPAVAGVRAVDRSARTAEGGILLPPLLGEQPLDLVFDLVLAPDAPASGALEVGLVRVSGELATSGERVMAEVPARIVRAAARGAHDREATTAATLARLSCLMHDVSTVLSPTVAGLARAGRALGAIVENARVAGVHGEPRVRAAVRILERALDSLLEEPDAALDRLCVASDAVTRMYDASPGRLARVDLGAFRTSAQDEHVTNLGLYLPGLRR